MIPLGLFLFVLGSIVGSFVNAVADRYDGEKFLFGKQIRGRSKCEHCGRTLGALDLVPFLSFIFLRGRCRTCKSKLSFRYPLAELLGGIAFMSAPAAITRAYPESLLSSNYWILVGLLCVFCAALLLASLVDLRLTIIPDEIHFILIFVALASYAAGVAGYFEPAKGSFMGGFALLFGVRDSYWLNRLVGVVASFSLIGGIYYLSRGRAMGFGDVKLALAMALFLGWPDSLMSLVFAFFIGSVFGIYAIIKGRGSLKTAVPFGPYIAAGFLSFMLWGDSITKWYFSLFRG
jgi:prepilin signal peptidase PulO-like enzyme (type II secretory pathway)